MKFNLNFFRLIEYIIVVEKNNKLNKLKILKKFIKNIKIEYSQ
jgi:hypothetical protein